MPSYSRISAVALLSRLALATLSLLSPRAAAVENHHAAQLIHAKADTTKKNPPPAPIVVPPGNELYQAQRGDSIPSVARKYLKKTKYLTSRELAEAMRADNGNRQGTFLKSGEQILIPGILESPIVEKPVPVARDFEVRAIYLTGVMAGSDHGERIIRHWREVGGNAVVFDIKDSDGIVNIAFDHPLASGQRHYISDLPKLVLFLHSQNMHAIARIAIFRDEHLVTSHPELAVKSRRTGGPWRENGKLVWTDPSNPKVQEYNIALAKFVAESGVDEVQFDYVRFPAEGDQKDATFAYESDFAQTGQDPKGQLRSDPPHFEHAQPEQPPAVQAATVATADDTAKAPTETASKTGHVRARHARAGQAGRDQPGHDQNQRAKQQRSDVIAGFLKHAYAQIHPTGVLFSLDVFGVMAWQRPVDLAHTGQDIVAMASHCDVLSPMIYPSHFFGMDGIARPGDAPEHFIGESMDRFKLITKDSGVVIRPWLQAFAWRTKTYSPQYVEVQVEVARQKGGVGFLFWNANNDYSKPFVAMPEMRASKDKYFRGDEVGATPEAKVAGSAVTSAANGGSAQAEQANGAHKGPIRRH